MLQCWFELAFFWIATFTGVSPSATSNARSITIPPLAPNLQSVALDGTHATIAFTPAAGSPSRTTYAIWVGGVSIGTLPTSSPYTVTTSLVSGTFTLIATCDGASSIASNPVTTTAPPAFAIAQVAYKNATSIYIRMTGVPALLSLDYSQLGLSISGGTGSGMTDSEFVSLDSGNTLGTGTYIFTRQTFALWDFEQTAGVTYIFAFQAYDDQVNSLGTLHFGPVGL